MYLTINNKTAVYLYMKKEKQKNTYIHERKIF